MSRLVTSGFELQSLAGSSTISNGEGQLLSITGSPAIETTTVRSGAAAARSNAASEFVNWDFAGVSARHYYGRAYMRFVTLPSSTTTIVGFNRSTAEGLGDVARIRITSAGVVQLWDASAQLGSDGPTLVTGVWYCLELHVMADTGASAADTAEARVDGVMFASVSGTDRSFNIPKTFRVGLGGTTGSPDVIYDDIAVNDDQGADQNSWPGEGKIVLLKPTGDNALGTGWEAPQTTGSDTTNIYDAVDNVPPVGVAHSDADANNLKYIFNAASNATTNYDANVTTYTAAGIGAGDPITLAEAIVNTGSSSATDTAGAVRLVSNPADSGETSFAAYDSGVAGTYPSNWLTTRGATVYAPSVTVGTAPVVRVGKRTATTRVAMVDFIGVYVEYAPAGVPDVNMADRIT